MGTTARDSGGEQFSPAPAGNHNAVCCAIVDLGTQYSEKWNKSSDRVLLGWEIDEKKQDGKRFVLWKEYTLSLHQKASLRAELQSWRGKAFTADELRGFELRNVLGAPCMLTVIHNVASNGNTYANVAAVGPLPKGMDRLTAEQTTYFNLDDPDMSVFNGFGDFLKRKIESSEQWKNKTAPPVPQGPVGSEDGDELPF